MNVLSVYFWQNKKYQRYLPTKVVNGNVSSNGEPNLNIKDSKIHVNSLMDSDSTISLCFVFARIDNIWNKKVIPRNLFAFHLRLQQNG